MSSEAQTMDTIKEGLAISTEAIQNAKKNWFTAGVALIPTFHIKGLIKIAGYTKTPTEFYKDLSVAHNLKSNTLGTLQNTFKNIVNFKEALRFIEIPGSNIHTFNSLFKEAKLHSQGAKLTLNGVKKAVSKYLDSELIEKSETDYITNIDQQIEYTEILANEIGNSVSQSQKTSSSTKAQASSSTKAQVSSSTKAQASSSTKAQARQKIIDDKFKSIASEDSNNNSQTNAPTETKIESNKNTADQSSLATETTVDTKKVAVDNPSPIADKTPETKTDTVTETDNTDEITTAYNNLNQTDKQLIGKVAASMNGDHNLAMIMALSDSNKSLLLEMMNRISK